MKSLFDTYKPRKIEFEKLVHVGDWNVKVYSITNKEIFRSHDILKRAVSELHKWLSIPESSELSTYKMGFLIVHEAREGVWILLNWWTGGEMIETKVFFADYKNPKALVSSPYGVNSLLCVWELEIIVHERQAWIDHVLSNATDPDFKRYMRSNLKQVV